MARKTPPTFAEVGQRIARILEKSGLDRADSVEAMNVASIFLDRATDKADSGRANAQIDYALSVANGSAQELS